MDRERRGLLSLTLRQTSERAQACNCESYDHAFEISIRKYSPFTTKMYHIRFPAALVSISRRLNDRAIR